MFERAHAAALALVAVLLCGGLASHAAAAEEKAPAKLSAAELDELVGPIALYPDDLLGIVLPATTYPIQVVQAARFLERQKSDPDLKPSEEWDPSVLGLLNYPEVVGLLNKDLDWTWKLGEAVVAQQSDVMDAVQRFRGKADAAGNLASNEQMKVTKESEQDQQIIVIESSSPDVIYVPQYQPSTVVVASPAPYPYSYSAPYPYYYNPAAAFWTGMFVGAAIGYGCGWGWDNGGYNNNIEVNKNVNIDRDGRKVEDRQGNRGDRQANRGDRQGSRGGGERWQQERRPGSASGGRPGSAEARRTSDQRRSAERARTGGQSRPSAGSRSGTQTSRAGSARSGSTRPGSSRPSASQQRSRSGSDLSNRSSSGRRSTYSSGA